MCVYNCVTVYLSVYVCVCLSVRVYCETSERQKKFKSETIRQWISFQAASLWARKQSPVCLWRGPMNSPPLPLTTLCKEQGNKTSMFEISADHSLKFKKNKQSQKKSVGSYNAGSVVILRPCLALLILCSYWVWLKCYVSVLVFSQAIKILGTEKGKKNKTNLIFVAGSRVLKYAERSYSVERALTSLLK